VDLNTRDDLTEADVIGWGSISPGGRERDRPGSTVLGAYIKKSDEILSGKSARGAINMDEVGQALFIYS
jgi:hypothetical protein